MSDTESTVYPTPAPACPARPKLLDLFCGAGGCSVGYHRAGFDVTGVDMKKMPRYPFEFHQADALAYLAEHGHKFDAIHASPPCQRYSRASFRKASKEKHPDLLGPTRDLLLKSGRTWVMENVPGAPVQDHPIELCGLMFGLKVFRHRWFESNAFLMNPAHTPHGKRRIGKDGFVCVIGHGGGTKRMRMVIPKGYDTKANWSLAMGIDWMTRDELVQAIPPAYTEFIGRQLMAFRHG